MRTLKLTTSAVALVHLMLVPAMAGPRGNSGSHGPSTHAAKATKPVAPPSSGPKATAPKSTGPKTSGAKAPTAKPTQTAKAPSSGATRATKPTTRTSPSQASAKSSPRTTGGGSAKKGAAASPSTSTVRTTTGSGTTSGSGTTITTASGTTSSPTGGSTRPAIDFAAAPVGQKLSKNTALQSKLATRLERLGYEGTVFEAAYGFKNLGQFVAATNVSQNHGISFQELKLQMTGMAVDADGNVQKDTTVVPKSLGQSIQSVKIGVDATAIAQTATLQADSEIANTTTAPAPTTTTAPSTTTAKTGRKKS